MIHYDIPLPAHAPTGSRTHINVQLDGTQLFLLVTDFLSTCADIKNRCRAEVHKETCSLPINKLTSSTWSPLFTKNNTSTKMLVKRLSYYMCFEKYTTSWAPWNKWYLNNFSSKSFQISPFLSNESNNAESWKSCPVSQHVESIKI